MNCTISIVITSFQRPHLLKWGLCSLARQDIPYSFETIVINDGIIDETEEICNQYKDKLNLKYIFSGQRNLEGNIKWRASTFPINIGVKKSSGKILILSCAEMYHINNTIKYLIPPVLNNPKLLGIPTGWDDQKSVILDHVNNTDGNIDINLLEQCQGLDTRLPFLMAVSREEFFSIGGFDEDFTGFAFEDNDFTDRLQLDGCSYQLTEAKTVHLYHPRYTDGKGDDPNWQYNKNLWLSRKGTIVRNQDREWGKL